MGPGVTSERESLGCIVASVASNQIREGSMASKIETILVCDLCESESLVDTHTLEIDGHRVELEACDPCWGAMVEHVAPVAKVGRKISRSKRRQRTP